MFILVRSYKSHESVAKDLDTNFADCKDWTEFDSSDENFKILGGKGDMDTYSTTEMPGQEGNFLKVLR